MKLSLEALQVLDAIDRKGSFAGAAAELHRVPSALTYQVQKLEQDLDVLLFDRRGHRAVLTAPGRELLKEGRNLLRAADDLECRVKRLATGWEVELRLSIDTNVPLRGVLDLLEAFYREDVGTRLRLSREVLGGNWDALVDRRADLVIGASGEAPTGGGYSSQPLGELEWLFAVAPHHPLAQEAEPLGRETILRHRAVAVGDTSRRLPPRTTGLYSGQDVLTVPDMETKLRAQIAGLGCGFLPRLLAQPAIDAGRLIAKEVEESKPPGALRYAWRTGETGKALKWFLKRLEQLDTRRALLGR